MAYAVLDKIKIIDFVWPWRSVLQQESCGAFFPARRFCCEKNLRNLLPIFLLVINDRSSLYRLQARVNTRDMCYTSVDCNFSGQLFVNIAFMKLCHLWEIAFCPWLEVGRLASDVGGTVGFSYNDSWAFW